MLTLHERLQEEPFQGYAYAYPHKTAYRHFDTPLPLRDLWAEEDKQALFLYLHLPFCEMRCGFCNLFTTVNPREGKVARYLDALPTTGNEHGRAFRDLAMEAKVLQIARSTGIGAQFGGKYFALDVRVAARARTAIVHRHAYTASTRARLRGLCQRGMTWFMT